MKNSEVKSKLWKVLTRTVALEESHRKTLKAVNWNMTEEGAGTDAMDEAGAWPFIDWNSEFKPAAIWHDNMYEAHEAGILPEDWTRLNVDHHFFAACHAIVQAADSLEERSRLYKKLAWYILAVQKIGRLVW